MAAGRTRTVRCPSRATDNVPSVTSRFTVRRETTVEYERNSYGEIIAIKEKVTETAEVTAKV